VCVCGGEGGGALVHKQRGKNKIKTQKHKTHKTPNEYTLNTVTHIHTHTHTQTHTRTPAHTRGFAFLSCFIDACVSEKEREKNCVYVRARAFK